MNADHFRRKARHFFTLAQQSSRPVMIAQAAAWMERSASSNSNSRCSRNQSLPGSWSREVKGTLETASCLTSFCSCLTNYLGTAMSDVFHWHTQLERGKTYAERAEECRSLAKVCPAHLRETYLELAAGYEQLAKQGE